MSSKVKWASHQEIWWAWQEHPGFREYSYDEALRIHNKWASLGKKIAKGARV